MINSAQIIGFLLVSGNFRTGDSEISFPGETGNEKVNHAQGDTASKNSVSDFGEDQEYFPYGETWVHNKATSEQQSTPYKFTSKELDEETGNYYHGARYYDPKLSRWISADPAVSTGEYFPTSNKKRNANLPGMGGVFNSANLDAYQYAHNNPARYTDPDGRVTFDQKTKKLVAEPGGSDPNVGSINGGKSKPRVNLDGGVLNENLNQKLNQFAMETDTYIKSSMGNDRSATRNRPAQNGMPADSTTSQHYTGNAFDFIQHDNKGNRLSVEKSADLTRQSKLFTGIEISPISNFVHVDLRHSKTVEDPMLFEQMTSNPYTYKYGNDSPFWSSYSQGKYIQYP